MLFCLEDTFVKIAICSDHGGYALKLEVISLIRELGHEVCDFGCNGETVGYPDVAFPVAQAVARGDLPGLPPPGPVHGR